MTDIALYQSMMNGKTLIPNHYKLYENKSGCANKYISALSVYLTHFFDNPKNMSFDSNLVRNIMELN